eukprot:m.325648 g.325648  ORF g.325648 m.325648 type:complete len:334 (+) comp40097_c0_seq1:114-1115(+)
MGCTSSRPNRDRGDEEDEDECYVDQLPSQSYLPAARLPQELRQLYRIQAKMGEGSFSEVVRAEVKATREPRAIKIIRKDGARETMEAIATELKIMQRARHPHVLRLYDVFETDEHVFAVMELATGGELFDRIIERGVFSEPAAVAVVRQCLEAVSYLHQIGVCHRDLKPENILYYHPGPDSKIMIADFGLAHLNEHNPMDMITGTCGSPEYLAPELLTGKPYTQAVDLWALGVITFILLGGYMPFDEPTRPALFRKIGDADYTFLSPNWDSVSKPGRAFVSGLLMRDPRKRMTAEEALAHAWIAGMPEPTRRPPKLEMKRRRASHALEMVSVA